MTNLEAIKNMTIEELIENKIINNGKYYGKVPAYEWDDFDHCYYGNDDEGCRQWLNQESNFKK